jgi:hypothetical protein
MDLGSMLKMRRKVEGQGGARELVGLSLSGLVSYEAHVFTRDNYWSETS